MTAPTSRTVLPHMRLSWGGELGSPAAEIFSNSVAFAPDLTSADDPTPPNAAELQLIADDLAPLILSWFQRPDSQISHVAKLTWIKAVWVLSTGRQRDTNTALHEIDQQPGGLATNAIWEQTYALTLRSNLNRGRGHAGRIYPPLSGAVPDSQGPYCTTASATTMASSFKGLLAGCVDQIALSLFDPVPVEKRHLYPVIVSAGNSDTGVLPKLTFIRRVVCDRVADIQHRRTNRVQRSEGNPSLIYPTSMVPPIVPTD